MLVVSCLSSAMAVNKGRKQIDLRTPVRFEIHHADPWAVKAMLEGNPISQPEISTILGFRGGGSQRQTNKSPLLQDGYLVVNPTDNSLWWYPNR